MVSKKSETFQVRLPGAPLSFRFDEGGWLLGQVHTDQSPAELADMARHDLDTSARNWALRELSASTDSAAVDARRFIVRNEHEPDLRVEALRQMARNPTHEDATVARTALRDPDGAVRSQALQSLSTLAPDGLDTTALAMYRTDPEEDVRATALAVYAGAAGARALATLEEATSPDLPLNIRSTAVRMLGRLRDPGPPTSWPASPIRSSRAASASRPSPRWPPSATRPAPSRSPATRCPITTRSMRRRPLACWGGSERRRREQGSKRPRKRRRACT